MVSVVIGDETPEQLFGGGSFPPELLGGCSGGFERVTNVKRAFFREIRKITALIAVLGASFSLYLDISFAQDNDTFQKSFFRSQVSRIDSPSVVGRRDIGNSLTIEDVVSTQFQENGSVDDTIVRRERQQGALTFMKNVYNQNYIDNIVSSRAIDALDLSESASQKLAAYEFSMLIARVLSSSPIANIYEEITEDIKEVRNYMMLRVSPQRDGSMGFENRKKYGRSPTFLEFRISPSTQDGVQPRLRMGENFSLSYDFSESTPLIEYNINF